MIDEAIDQPSTSNVEPCLSNNQRIKEMLKTLGALFLIPPSVSFLRSNLSAPKGRENHSSIRMSPKSIRGEDWFEALFGFQEESTVGRVQDNFEIVNNSVLKSKINGAAYEAGTFSTPSLAELRQSVLGGTITPQPDHEEKTEATFEHLATDGAFQMHTLPEYKDAVVMVASQANCLEFTSPDGTPERGVTGYFFDRTQGPACSIAAPAATVYRNYFVPMGNGQIGQSRDNQINNYEELLNEIQGGQNLVHVKNGYTSSTTDKLEKLNALLPEDDATRDSLLGKLRIGLHLNAQIPWGVESTESRFTLLEDTDQVVTQCFCSALSCGYSQGSIKSWEPLARIVLDASYEAVLLAGAVHGNGVVLLTMLGGGVFGNEAEWIEDAIVRAFIKMKNIGGLKRVILCHHRYIREDVSDRIATKISIHKGEVKVD